ncbi:transketolase-like [Pseudoliparis swirei]|uniref:transketolase-like n=1 Tax=Pseudoliparis swirei TaxID=2059687 RepID=UPI0024BE96AF|nr:transketolase-like [Pseudoliparis swirei]
MKSDRGPPLARGPDFGHPWRILWSMKEHSRDRHPTSCCSVAEIMSVLFFNTMKYRPEDPRNPNNDRFILSKGHAAPVLYAVWAETGYLKENELLNLRKVDSILEGHPVPVR